MKFDWNRPPSNTEMSTTWPAKEEERDPAAEERRRQAIEEFFAQRDARRAMWRKRRGWETP